MQRVVISGAFAALAYRAAAGVAAPGASEISFVDQSWDDACEGSVWPIKWSKGNGKNLSVKVKGDDSWEDTISESEAAPGSKDWTVEVPKCDAEYTLEIQQDGCETLVSPKFTVACAGDGEWDDEDGSKDGEWEDKDGSKDGEWDDKDEPEGGWTDGKGPKPSKVTVVYYEEDCSCTKTKETPAPTNNSPVWYDDDLKCSVTIDPASPTQVWEDAPADAAHTWGDGPAPADAKTWGDGPAPADATWADAADPAAKTWGDGPAPADATWADAADPAAKTPAAGETWADAADPAKTPAAGETWADAADPAKTPAAGNKNVAPLENAPAGDGAKGVADYTGAASKLTGSIGALAAIFLAALAL